MKSVWELQGNCPNPVQPPTDLRACANSQMDGVTLLQASIDGVPLNNLEMFRAESSLFQFTAVDGNPFGIPPGTTDSG